MGSYWLREAIAIAVVPLLALLGVVTFGLVGGDVAADVATPILLALVAVGASSPQRASGVLTAFVVAAGFAAVWGQREPVRALFVGVASVIIGVAVGVLADRAARVANRLDVAEARLKRLAMRDTLTGLLDRRGFHSALGLQLARESGRAGTLAILALDVDKLKVVNDRFGRATGDTLLEHLAESLEKNIRESDIAGRVDADEFAVILAGTAQPEAKLVARRIVTDFQRHLLTIVPAKIDTGVTFGIALFPADGDQSDALLDAADRQIARMKAGSKRPGES